MAKLMGRAAMEARNEFVLGTQESEKNTLWSLTDLNKLSKNQLIDRLEQIEGQGYLMKCRILWELRQRFASDKLFGQYLNEIRSATSPAWDSSSSDISRSIATGRFCDQHKISDLTKAKIYKGAIYALSMMPDKESAVKILTDIRHKNVPVKDVERMIEQSKAVATIDQQVVIRNEQATSPLRTVQVIDNQAIESTGQLVIEPPALFFESAVPDMTIPSTATMQASYEPAEVILDHTEIIAQIMQLVRERYQLSLRDMILIFKGCINAAQDSLYPKK
jgi:hypothetical protein